MRLSEEMNYYFHVYSYQVECGGKGGEWECSADGSSLTY